MFVGRSIFQIHNARNGLCRLGDFFFTFIFIRVGMSHKEMVNLEQELSCQSSCKVNPFFNSVGRTWLFAPFT